MQTWIWTQTRGRKKKVDDLAKIRKKERRRKAVLPAQSCEDAELAYKRHLLRVDLQNISISMEARQSRLDEYCETVCERFQVWLRRLLSSDKHWKPPRKRSTANCSDFVFWSSFSLTLLLAVSPSISLLKKKVIKKLIKGALKLPSKVVLTPHTVSKDGSGINGYTCSCKK